MADLDDLPEVASIWPAVDQPCPYCQSVLAVYAVSDPEFGGGRPLIECGACKRAIARVASSRTETDPDVTISRDSAPGA